MNDVARMDLPDDITSRIRRDFSSNDATSVEQRLEALFRDEPQLFSERIMRCIVFASSGRLPIIDHYITMTRADSRDVIVAGECDDNWKHIRNFNRPFDSQ